MVTCSKVINVTPTLICETVQHIPGEFQPSKVYVRIEEHGYAFDNFVCKQEPIVDEYGQQPEHYFEAPPSVWGLSFHKKNQMQLETETP